MNNQFLNGDISETDLLITFLSMRNNIITYPGTFTEFLSKGGREEMLINNMEGLKIFMRKM